MHFEMKNMKKFSLGAIIVIRLAITFSFYRAMHFSAFARSCDRMSSVRPSVCNVGDL